MDFLIILLFGFGIMWLLVVLPQRRRQRAHDDLVRGIQPGDYVVTAGGLYGTVTEIGNDDVGLEIAPDVEARVAKKAIAAVVPPEEIEEVDADDESAAETAVEPHRG